MKYLIKKVNNKNRISNFYLNKKKDNLLIFNKKSKFGYTNYKKRFNFSKFFLTKNSNIYFSKNRKMKSAIKDIKIIDQNL